jgi:hypothetical protein
MANLENPAQKLAQVINRLYELAGNLPDDTEALRQQRVDLLHQAHDLRGDLSALVSLQLSESTPAYVKVMADLDGVTDALNQAEAKISDAVEVVNGVADLAKSIDDLLKEAISVGALFA